MSAGEIYYIFNKRYDLVNFMYVYVCLFLLRLLRNITVDVQHSLISYEIIVIGILKKFSKIFINYKLPYAFVVIDFDLIYFTNILRYF
jgi:hypothetical protein